MREVTEIAMKFMDQRDELRAKVGRMEAVVRAARGVIDPMVAEEFLVPAEVGLKNALANLDDVEEENHCPT